ncbi:DUF2935 domain-containing protein [Paenibacillus sp.]|uniref:DUF2935 domain-containing protein n=1 Tax=Paenibacillus sp. TaxID=58172 RepID=UPI002D4D083D|nr:DUF2935 domain-containing protein [Paenibacillus sp.]HZG84861.1 DUF2935 domain-containing protein [Paenibacillus sp.]
MEPPVQEGMPDTVEDPARFFPENRVLEPLPRAEVEPTQDDLFMRISGGRKLADWEFVERSLEENRFWMRVMMEHAFFLKITLPNEATEFLQLAEEFEASFAKQLHRALHETPANPSDVEKLNLDSIDLLTRAMEYKQNVFYRNVNGDFRGMNWTKTAEHIRREPLYVIKTLLRLNSKVERPLIEELVEDNEFFLKIMAEHGVFALHFLDPDEDDILDLARLMGDKFKVLTMQARNLEIEPPSKTAILSQLTIFRGSTLLFHGLMEEVHRLTQEKEIRGVADPNIIGHITREAGKYLTVLDRMEARIKNTPIPRRYEQ